MHPLRAHHFLLELGGNSRIVLLNLVGKIQLSDLRATYFPHMLTHDF